MEVSIHAPARGATQGRHPRRHRCRVSIHAPARGATDVGALREALRDGFNPRARAGRDQTPTAAAAISSGFNPRARAGRD